MKALIALSLTLVSVSAFATDALGETTNTVTAQACYKAVNPEVISVEVFPQEHEETIKSTGKRATLALSTLETQMSESGVRPEKYTSKIGFLRAVTDNETRVKVWSNMNEGLKTKLPTYSVDCDGGSMTVEKAKNGALVLNSNYIAGEAKTMDEGCASASLTFKNLVVKPISCKDVVTGMEGHLK